MQLDRVQIVYIEGSSPESRLVREGLSEWETSADLHCVRESEAMQVLESLDSIDLILLSLSAAGAYGLETLKDLKSNPNLKCIPVIVLMDRASDGSCDQAYQFGANCCIERPLDVNEFFRKLKGVENFWLKVADLPKSCLKDSSVAVGAR